VSYEIGLNQSASNETSWERITWKNKKVMEGKYYDQSSGTGFEKARRMEVSKGIHRWQAVMVAVLNLQILLGLKGN
jgi:hypothetical protein